MDQWIDWFSPQLYHKDLSQYEGVRFYVALSQLDKPKYTKQLEADVTLMRNKGLKIMLCIDFHTQTPVYHGPPETLREYGLAPFGWTKGWIWAREHIAYITERIWPEYIQVAEEPHVREGWTFLNGQRRPDVAFYNDTLLIYKQALLLDANWDKVLVIPNTPGSDVQKEGVKRASTGWVDRAVGFSKVWKESDIEWLSFEELMDPPPPAEEPDEDPYADDVEDEVADIIEDRPDDNFRPDRKSHKIAVRSLDAALANDFDKAVRLMKRARKEFRRA